ncbi:phage tail assembly protein [Aeromonas hydrophila]|uniref:phage tail assembly protein n=1 Tax=Aeromonas hydrophila TaxID=644 RepID=UPI001CC596EF|nr:phage tail assembly protein [Aeromonas hydrophila]GJC04144.1 tail protein [Aeromonas hydrophila]
MDQKEITLDTPIQRGESTLNSLIIRSPKKAGHLRGLNTMDIVQMNVDTLIKLLPRITDLTEKEVNDMDPADLLKAGVVVVGFLMASQQEAYLTA